MRWAETICASNETCEGTQCKACPTAAQVCGANKCGVVQSAPGCAPVDCGVDNCATNEVCENGKCEACPTKDVVCGGDKGCTVKSQPPAACQGKVDYNCLSNCTTNEACEAGQCTPCAQQCGAAPFCGPNVLLCPTGKRTNCPACGGG